ncbi:MAG: peptidoglycan editing factor PgeF [Candidatus Moraniibacteriota bacterium]
MQYGYSTRADGSMRLAGLTGSGEGPVTPENAKNRDRYFEKEGLQGKKIVSAQLVHGKEVAVVEKNSLDYILGTDGLVTSDPDVVLTITAADCYPVYFFDVKNQIVGLAHAGWRGVVKYVVTQMVRCLCELGSEREELEVIIGPGICEKHFTVKPENVVPFEKMTGFNKVVRLVSEGAEVDLRLALKEELKKNGVSNILDQGECTHCLSETYFSWRRDHPPELETQVAFITL